MNALGRLQLYNRTFAARCAVARWFAAAFHVGVQSHLIADAKHEQQKARDVVYGEKERNLANAAAIQEVLADGKVTPDELPKLRGIARGELVGAEKLHDATERLTP